MSDLDKRSFLKAGVAGLVAIGSEAASAKVDNEGLSIADRQNMANGRPGPRVIPGRAVPVPRTDVSPAAQTAISQPYNKYLDWNLAPTDSSEWRKVVADSAASSARGLADQRKRLSLSIDEIRIGGVRCFVIEPAAIPPHHRNQQVIVAHGGGYVFGPGVSGTSEAALIAAIGGYRTITVDYRMPPDSPAPAAVEDMVSVWHAIAGSGNAARVAMAGTSAGGGLILATLLRAKKLGLPMPGAIAPSSPWSDLSETGDSYRSNEWLDNILVSYSGYLGRAARLYAGDMDLHDPLLSPIYGDFSGFPATILTAGTRDLFLSNTVRVHRKLRRANVVAELHVYEGLSHAQFNIDSSLPETNEIYREITRFFDRHLACS